MKRLFILFLIPVMLTSCNDFLDVNVDPNNPTEVAPALILPVGQTYTATYITSSRYANHFGGMMMANWSESYGFSWYDEEFRYSVTTNFYGRLFDYPYSNALKQYHDFERLGDEYIRYKAVGNIMKAFHFQMLVDFYGDVPYTEALQRGGNATPKYDKAEDIYKDLIVKLDSSIAMLNRAETMDAVQDLDGDMMFGGDVMTWKKFANTLKLRIIVRAGHTSVIDGASEIAKIEAEGSGYIDGDVGVNPGYLDEEGKQSPFWASFGFQVPDGSGDLTPYMNQDATCASEYFVTILTGDPRIDYILERPDGGQHKGVQQGVEQKTEDLGADFVSNMGPGLLQSAKQDAIIMTLAESKFLRSEAALNGWSSDDATAMYEEGIAASFDYLGVDATDAATYISNHPYSGLESIMMEKYKALAGITAEQTWMDYNRTGFPSDVPVSNFASTPDRPVRLMYPASETTSNGGNVPAQTATDCFGDANKIFWAK